MSEIINDIFNTTPIVTQPEQTVISEFRPAAKKGQAGVYKAVVRFLPNPKDPQNKSIISKYTAFLKNPLTQASMEVDCPSTVGQPDIIQNTFFALRNSQNAVLQENSKQFSRKQRYASLVQVISCDSEPSLVNRILVWRYGFKIYEKLQAEMNPPMGQPRNPFHPINGRPFSVVVKEVGGFNNFDACSFFDVAAPDGAMRIEVEGKDGQMQWYAVTDKLIANANGRKLVNDYLLKAAPDLSQYEYKPWTQEVTDFVNSCVQILSNPSMTVNAMAAAQNPVANTQQPMFNQGPAAAPQTFTMPGAGLDEMPIPPTNTAVPSMGLSNVGDVDPRGNQPLNLPGDIDSLVNGSASAPQAAPQMNAGLDLDDVLKDIY